MSPIVVMVLALVAAGLGALGGLGGAILLVPVLVLSGMSPAEAAPLGLVLVAAGSVAAAPRQLSARCVNHRLGVTVEIAASGGAVVGALAAGMVADGVLRWILAAVALASAVMTWVTRDPSAAAVEQVEVEVGERIGSLGAVLPDRPQPTAYRVERLPAGLGLMTVAGLIAGTAGVGGGFIKTPVTAGIMRVPARAAAATTTFTIGITAAAALLVAAAQGRVDAQAAAAVIVGGLVGGHVGATVQVRGRPQTVSHTVTGLLIAIAVILVLT